MLRYLKDEKKYVLITGYSAERRIEVEKIFDWMATKDEAVQVFDAESIAGWQHIYHAVINAIAAFRAEANITRNLGMEILIYVSGQHQINRAFQTVGIRDSTRKICLVVAANSERKAITIQKQFQERFGLRREDSTLAIESEDKIRHLKQVFSIDEMEIETMRWGRLEQKEILRGLIIERGALLITKR
jgi:tRNA threonylcarbamoyladenosine modification (KEOPS) complex Cgi121 subunit